MSREAAQRYASTLELGEDLRAYLEHRVSGVSHRPDRRAAQVGPAQQGARGVDPGRRAARDGRWSRGRGRRRAGRRNEAEAKRKVDEKNQELVEATEALRRSEAEARASAAAAREAQSAAEAARGEAVDALERERRQRYLTNISTAAALIAAGFPDDAARRLADCDAIYRGWEWGHLQLSVDPAIFRLDAPSAVAITTGKRHPRLYVGSSFGEISVVGPGGQEEKRLENVGSPSVLTTTHDDRYLVAGTSRGEVLCWDEDGRAHEFRGAECHDGEVSFLAVSPRTVVPRRLGRSGTGPFACGIWNAGSGSPRSRRTPSASRRWS